LAIDVSHTETKGWGDVEIDRMRNAMMANQVVAVDLVSAATGTSMGFRTAVSRAAEAAGGARPAQPDVPPNNDGIDLVQPGGPGTRITGVRVGVNPRSPNTPPPRSHDYVYTLTAREAVIIATLMGGAFLRQNRIRHFT